VRAQLYAAFHSARTPAGDAEQPCRPISRQTLRRLSAVSPSSQRAYERRAGVVSRPNWALGPRKSPEVEQQLAWRHGRALFTLVDREGAHGPAGEQYLAWRLPNSYAGPHERLAPSRKRRINRQLNDLAQIGTPGNVERLYCADGRDAAAGGGSDDRARYWPGVSGGRIRGRLRGNERGQMWYAMRPGHAW